jgi:hypothetical protein
MKCGSKQFFFMRGGDMNKIREAFRLVWQRVKPSSSSVCLAGRATGFSMVLVLCFTLSAEADIVYGRVYDATNKYFQPGDNITISRTDPNGNLLSVTAKTDKKDGGYSVTLPPGTYDVEFKKNDKTLRGKIQSFPRPNRQDIHLLEK